MNELQALRIDLKKLKAFALDQRLLPHESVEMELNTIEDAYVAIRDMVVRGAPLIGFTAIVGVALYLRNLKEFNQAEFNKSMDYLNSARPTAVNLKNDVDLCRALVSSSTNKNSTELSLKMFNYALERMAQLEDFNTSAARSIFESITAKNSKPKYNFMTICNTGRLACGAMGTALGVVEYFHQQNRLNQVFFQETRPYMQGSRLTAYEVEKLQMPGKLIVDSAVSYIMEHNKIDGVFVGADRIAKNGDTANKIGTHALAIQAKHFGIPFFVVAPLSSFDFTIESGAQIPIEMRGMEEIKEYKKNMIAPRSIEAINPSFDVTPAQLITGGIACEKGLFQPDEIKKLV